MNAYTTFVNCFLSKGKFTWNGPYQSLHRGWGKSVDLEKCQVVISSEVQGWNY